MPSPPIPPATLPTWAKVVLRLWAVLFGVAAIFAALVSFLSLLRLGNVVFGLGFDATAVIISVIASSLLILVASGCALYSRLLWRLRRAILLPSLLIPLICVTGSLLVVVINNATMGSAASIDVFYGMIFSLLLSSPLLLVAFISWRYRRGLVVGKKVTDIWLGIFISVGVSILLLAPVFFMVFFILLISSMSRASLELLVPSFYQTTTLTTTIIAT